jgi:glucosamine--fructose-6-phosphate aminotransferase (isomerizing)
MCGIFAAVGEEQLSQSDVRKLQKLANLSERRGSDSSGLLFVSKSQRLIEKKYSGISSWINASLRKLPKDVSAIFGHTRLATHGDDSSFENNQPISDKGWLIFHNGIVTNSREYVASNLVDSYSISKVLAEVNELDQSEILRRLRWLKGEVSSIAIGPSGTVLVYSNVGGLFLAKRRNGTVFIASEKFFLEKLGFRNITRVIKDEPHFLRILNEDIFESDVTYRSAKPRVALPLVNPPSVSIKEKESILSLISSNYNSFRCKKCILPSNFPDLRFDSDGTCMFCNTFQPTLLLGENRFHETLSYKNPEKSVLVNLSGGRDSCYALHLLKHHGFNPIAFTYDWGFVSTAARENMARMCGDLGIEHIVVSPNIEKNRTLAKAALSAWIKKPDPATIPILMAGDKPLFTFSMRIAKENGGIPIIHGDHSFETTYFKSALAGAKNVYDSTSGSVSYRLNIRSLMLMSFRYMGHISRVKFERRALFIQVLRSAFIYYGSTHRFVSVFQYLPWNEETIDASLKQYDWKSNGHKNDNNWRMGDATAPLYNLLYLCTVGFTENDCLISNQIRAGVLSRKAGLDKLNEMNKVNFEGIDSYLLLIGIEPRAFWHSLNESLGDLRA